MRCEWLAKICIFRRLLSTTTISDHTRSTSVLWTKGRKRRHLNRGTSECFSAECLSILQDLLCQY